MANGVEWDPNFKTESLLALDSCRPLKAKHVVDWARIVSPLRAREWESGLSSHPDRNFARYVCEGIREGFQIGRSAHCKHSPGNMGSAKKHKHVVEQYIGTECEVGRLLGPLDRSASTCQPIWGNPKI